MPIPHNGFIEEDFIDSGFIAGCSCGWEGPRRLARIECEGDLQKHEAEAKEQKGD